MVAVADKPASAPAREPGPVRRALADAFSDVVSCLPALMLAWLCLRAAETGHAAVGGIRVSILFGPALANDLLALLRYGFLFVLGAPLLALVPARRWRLLLLGVLWSALLIGQAGLLQYHWIAGVPLGADLLGYTRTEVAGTVGGGWRADAPLALSLLISLALLWTVLNACGRPWWPRASARRSMLAGAASMLAFACLPDHFAPPAARSEASVDYLLNKTAYFADRNLAHLAGGAATAGPDKGQLPWAGKDPRYPFLHPERTPDTLGPLFERKSNTPPNLVFIVVEGLGRTFSGPGARLGSFTPFLDELAGRSLYFDNFLAGQGRTFGVLTTVFGSLPFGDNGLAALGDRIPRHASLLSVLKSQGYRLNFYSGSNLDFDREGEYLRHEGVDRLVGERDFGPPAQRANEWGYADGDLVDMALRHARADSADAMRTPSVSIIQTISMHDPFTFPDKARYMDMVGQRLARLGIAADANPAYATQRAIFASILYTDDALRRFFEGAARLPGFENTVFVITGDHRLPELPMDTRIERYHVPLIVYSPLLKKPRAIKAVSSQFDIAPSLLAYLTNNYGLRSPSDVTWLGTGLDTEPAFRNLHVLPLKQTKTELSDFVSGSVYLAQGRLYALADGMLTDRAPDDKALATARAQFQGFLQANGVAARASELAPAAAVEGLAPYRAEGRSLRSVALAAEGAGVGVSGVRRAGRTGPDGVALVEATLRNQGSADSRPFVPLLVVSDAGGLEVLEAAGQQQTLAPGASLKVSLPARLGRLPHGTYFVSVIPSHPETGRSIGIGQYRVEMKL